MTDAAQWIESVTIIQWMKYPNLIRIKIEIQALIPQSYLSPIPKFSNK